MDMGLFNKFTSFYVIILETKLLYKPNFFELITLEFHI